MDKIHIQAHQKNLPGSKQNWGHAALCDSTIVLVNGQRTTTYDRTNCPACADKLIQKYQKQIDHLEWVIKNYED